MDQLTNERQQAAVLVRETLTKVKQFLAQEKPTKLSEADTKANFIEIYIRALGYEGFEAVVREYYVKNSQEFIDYVLRINSQAALAIEAKPLQTDLTDKHAAQITQYCSTEGIEWCALTNARSLWLFNTYLKGDLSQKLIAKIDLLSFNSDDEFNAIFDQLWLLSKSSLATPSIINSWMEQRRLDRAMRTILFNQHSETINAAAKELAHVAGIAASPESAVQWLRGQLAPNISILPPPVTREPKEAPEHQEGGPRYWLLPCSSGKDGSDPAELLHYWLDKGFWGLRQASPGRTQLHEGDYACFYVSKLGFAATARLAGPADILVAQEEWPEPSPPSGPIYKVPLREISWLSSPLPLTNTLCAKLDWFKGRDPDGRFGFLVQTARSITPHDFQLLTEITAA